MGTRSSFPAQVDDVVVDGAVGEDGADAPRGVEQLLTAQHASLVPHERANQLELGERQIERLATPPHLAAGEVHLHVGKLEDIRLADRVRSRLVAAAP